MDVFATEATISARDAQASVCAALAAAIAGTITNRELSQVQAARICRTDQPTLSEVLRGRTDSVSLDKLLGWLVALGRPVELRIGGPSPNNSATLTVAVDADIPPVDVGPKRYPRPVSDDSQPIYLDHHATTPVDPRVADVVMHAMAGTFGNANSIDHAFGEAAGAIVARASEAVAALVGSAPDDVYFTSGSTEAIRLALAHAISQGRRSPLRVALTKVEHKAVIDAVSIAARSGQVKLCWIEVDAQGRLSPDSLRAALDAGVDLVCLMAANNEVGTIYPVPEMARQIRDCAAAIMIDATHAAGRISLHARDWEVDYLIVSAHKLYGPKGVGALISPVGNLRTQMSDLIWASEGTPNVPGIAGFGEACRLRRLEMADDERRIAALRDRLQSKLTTSIPNLAVNGDQSRRLSGNLHISVPGIPNDALMARLRKKVAISTGSACTSGAHGPSHVLQAMGLSEALQEGALRIGVGKFNTEDEIDRAAKEIVAASDAVKASLPGKGR